MELEALFIIFGILFLVALMYAWLENTHKKRVEYINNFDGTTTLPEHFFQNIESMFVDETSFIVKVSKSKGKVFITLRYKKPFYQLKGELNNISNLEEIFLTIDDYMSNFKFLFKEEDIHFYDRFEDCIERRKSLYHSPFYLVYALDINYTYDKKFIP